MPKRCSARLEDASSLFRRRFTLLCFIGVSQTRAGRLLHCVGEGEIGAARISILTGLRLHLMFDVSGSSVFIGRSTPRVGNAASHDWRSAEDLGAEGCAQESSRLDASNWPLMCRGITRIASPSCSAPASKPAGARRRSRCQSCPPTPALPQGRSAAAWCCALRSRPTPITLRRGFFAFSGGAKPPGPALYKLTNND